MTAPETYINPSVSAAGQGGSAGVKLILTKFGKFTVALRQGLGFRRTLVASAGIAGFT
jgi:hypothetical protein